LALYVLRPTVKVAPSARLLKVPAIGAAEVFLRAVKTVPLGSFALAVSAVKSYVAVDGNPGGDHAVSDQ
jgi:hypothetical protein